MSTQYVCRLCGGEAVFHPEEDIFRHADSALGDVSTFCERYGYPIPVIEGIPAETTVWGFQGRSCSDE